MTCIYHITRLDDYGINTLLEGFAGSDPKETYDRADARLEYWWNKFPHAYIDITRKA